MPQHRAAFRDNFVDLVALGTVADVTPLIGENRVLVAHGLKALSTSKKVGLRALFLSMGLRRSRGKRYHLVSESPPD